MQNSGVFPETACPPASSAFGGLTGVPHIPRPSFSYPSLPALHVILHPTLQDPCIAATVVDSFSGSPGICPVGLSSVPASANHSQQRVLMFPLMCVGLSFWSGLPPVVQGSFTNHSCSLCFLGPNHSMTPNIINTYLLVCLPPPPLQGEGHLSFPNTVCPRAYQSTRVILSGCLPRFRVQLWFSERPPAMSPRSPCVLTVYPHRLAALHVAIWTWEASPSLGPASGQLLLASQEGLR